ncbi:hypothetical protein CEXT_357681 [Caerostris extrusa]|uniref:Uncharacterized protein n=1 Tax=Caerostris extrusa TaxID=172846 RepID=A0AAV4M801_CAEEX|nr:hypothetical protein CEXT_357681 [Caerostris extrusa]
MNLFLAFQKDDIPPKFLDAFCWMHPIYAKDNSTLKTDSTINSPMPRFAPKETIWYDDDAWISLLLLLLASAFCMPRFSGSIWNLERSYNSFAHQHDPREDIHFPVVLVLHDACAVVCSTCLPTIPLCLPCIRLKVLQMRCENSNILDLGLITDVLSIDDWFLIYLLSKNMDPEPFSDLMTTLTTELRYEINDPE